MKHWTYTRVFIGMLIIMGPNYWLFQFFEVNKFFLGGCQIPNQHCTLALAYSGAHNGQKMMAIRRNKQVCYNYIRYTYSDH